MALSQTEIQGKLRAVPGWELIKNKAIQKKFTFANFKDALAFVNKVGELAEQSNHHPDITINYNKVTLECDDARCWRVDEQRFRPCRTC